MPGNWEWEAACMGLDRDLFFVGEGKAGYKNARQICFGCPVMEICLWFAMACEGTEYSVRHGFFGGMSPEQRQELASRYSISPGVARQYYEEELARWNSSHSTLARQQVGHASQMRPL